MLKFTRKEHPVPYLAPRLNSIDNSAAVVCIVARYALEPFMTDAVVDMP